jgi:hypothetical protein
VCGVGTRAVTAVEVASGVVAVCIAEAVTQVMGLALWGAWRLGKGIVLSAGGNITRTPTTGEVLRKVICRGGAPRLQGTCGIGVREVVGAGVVRASVEDEGKDAERSVVIVIVADGHRAGVLHKFLVAFVLEPFLLLSLREGTPGFPDTDVEHVAHGNADMTVFLGAGGVV